MFGNIANWFIGLVQSTVDGLGVALEWILGVLPESPFEAISNLSADYMKWLNWLVPIDMIVAILQVWVSAIVIYYIYVIILRWIKAIQ